MIIMKPALDPLNEIMINFLMSKTKETAEYDFKYLVNLKKYSDFVKIVEDIFAMSNYGGGYILFGFKERDKRSGYDPVGLPDSYTIDDADIQRNFNSYSNEPIELFYKEFYKDINFDSNIVKKRFAILYVPPSRVVLYPRKDGVITDKKGRSKFVFRDKDILIRRGSVSDRASPTEIDWIKNRIKKEDYKISLISGEPDEINENLYSNIFKVTNTPTKMFECCASDEKLYELRRLTRENNISNRILSIPCDYRYNLADMKFITSKLNKILEDI